MIIPISSIVASLAAHLCSRIQMGATKRKGVPLNVAMKYVLKRSKICAKKYQYRPMLGLRSLNCAQKRKLCSTQSKPCLPSGETTVEESDTSSPPTAKKRTAAMATGK